MSTTSSSFNDCYPAVPSSVPVARSVLARLAADAGASPTRVDEIRLAASEALTNVVVHAYRDAPGTICVVAAVVSDELWVLIADEGCGLESHSDRPGLGLGLALIAQASNDFAIVPRSAGGTEIRMRFNLLAAESRGKRQPRGSVASAFRPASSRFSTTM